MLLSAVDEYDAFELDFTAADFHALDMATAAAMAAPEPACTTVPPVATEQSASSEQPDSGGNQSSHKNHYAADAYPNKASTLGNNNRRRVGGARSYSSTASSRSPYTKYRSKRKTLSVSDLVGPAWCEVQFDYGLQQGRHKKLSERLESFVTPKGTTIVANKDVALVHDRILTRGQSVHKKLEKELRPDEVEVPVVLAEERWALKLVQMSACLQDLLSHGYCREMPVFGIVDGLPVTGIIDEITRKPSKLEEEVVLNASGKRPSTPPQTSKSRAKKPRSPPSLQSRITSFFISPSKAPPKPPSESYVLSISDTKTRQSASMPSDLDARQSRLQLMLYYQLLSKLILTAFGFNDYWTMLGVDRFRALTDEFLIQSKLILPAVHATDSLPSRPTCLHDFVSIFSSMCEKLNVVAINPSLELVYRTRAGSIPKRHLRGPKRAKEDEDLQRAILASLSESGVAGHTTAAVLETPPGNVGFGKSGMGDDISAVFPAFGGATLESSTATLEKSTSTLESMHRTEFANSSEELAYIATHYAAVETTAPNALKTLTQEREDADKGERAVDFLKSKEQSTEDAALRPSLPADNLSAEDETETEDEFESQIIGRKTFSVDDEEISKYLESILSWWRGLREAEGVSVEQTRRCLSCEYKSGCEWRAKKALEIDARLGKIDEGAEEKSADGVASMF